MSEPLQCAFCFNFWIIDTSFCFCVALAWLLRFWLSLASAGYFLVQFWLLEFSRPVVGCGGRHNIMRVQGELCANFVIFEFSPGSKLDSADFATLLFQFEIPLDS